MMNAEEIPEWVPASVKTLGVRGSFDDELLMRRLVTDPQMKSVWQHLLRRAQPMDSEIVDSKWLQGILRVSETPISVQEQTCAVFFLYVINNLCAPRPARTRQDIENLVAPWRSAGEQCRLAISRLGSSASRELVKALSITAEYFESEAIFAGADANNPYTLKRRSGKPEDNNTRGRVRALALTTYPLYGSFQYGILARVATVALQTKVTARSVRNWCSDLPSLLETPQPAERPISPAQPS